MKNILYGIIILNSITIQNSSSQIRAFPPFTLHNKWYYSYSANIYDTLVFNNYNEVWEYVRDTVISDFIGTKNYKLVEATTYDLSRKVEWLETFKFNIQDSLLQGLGYYDTTLQIGTYRLNTVSGVTVSVVNMFGADRLACLLVAGESSFSGGGSWSWNDSIRTIAGIGIDYFKSFSYTYGQGSPYQSKSTLRILKGAVLNGHLFGDTTFVIATVEKETLLQSGENNITIDCFPNPFNSSSIIRYALPKSGIVKIEITNILGQSVGYTLNDYKEKGEHEWHFKSGNLTSGVYVVFIQLENYRNFKKILLLK